MHIKITLIAACLSTLTACGITNNDINLKDTSAQANYIGYEKALKGRSFIRGQIHSLTMNDQQQLTATLVNPTTETYSRDVVRLENTYWEGPHKLKREFDVTLVNLDLLFMPINNQHFTLYVGAGLRWHKSTLTLSPNPTQSLTEKEFGGGPTVGGVFKLNDHINFSINLNHNIYQNDLDKSSQHFEASVNWTPTQNIQLSVGGFEYQQSRSTHSNISQRRITGSCTTPDASAYCPSATNGNSEFYVEGSGLQGGITFKF